jgi:hypothetical protein
MGFENPAYADQPWAIVAARATTLTPLVRSMALQLREFILSRVSLFSVRGFDPMDILKGIFQYLFVTGFAPFIPNVALVLTQKVMSQPLPTHYGSIENIISWLLSDIRGSKRVFPPLNLKDFLFLFPDIWLSLLSGCSFSSFVMRELGVHTLSDMVTFLDQVQLSKVVPWDSPILRLAPVNDVALEIVLPYKTTRIAFFRSPHLPTSTALLLIRKPLYAMRQLLLLNETRLLYPRDDEDDATC